MDIANLKRESKAYSYEDQKWEAEVRLEMLRKKKAEAEGQKDGEEDIRTMIKNANLSQKRKVSLSTRYEVVVFSQDIHVCGYSAVCEYVHTTCIMYYTCHLHLQEAIESQLAYEESVRERLTRLDKQLANMVVVMEMTRGDVLTRQASVLSAAILQV